MKGLVFGFTLVLLSVLFVGGVAYAQSQGSCIHEATFAEYVNQAQGDIVNFIDLLNGFYETNSEEPGDVFNPGDILGEGVVFWGNLGVAPPPEAVTPVLAEGGWGVFKTVSEFEIPESSTGGRWMRVCSTTPTPVEPTGMPYPTATPSPTPVITPTPVPAPTREPVLSEPLPQTSNWFWWVVDSTNTLEESITILDSWYDSQSECQYLRNCVLYGGTVESGLALPTGSVFWGGDLGDNWEASYPQLQSYRNSGGVGYFRVTSAFDVPEGVGGRYLNSIYYAFLPFVR